MATEYNQKTKSMDSLESNASNTNANETDRKQISQNIKCEISSDKHQNEMQINPTTKCDDRKMVKPLKSISNCPELRAKVFR
jgi:hypothetical protein